MDSFSNFLTLSLTECEIARVNCYDSVNYSDCYITPRVYSSVLECTPVFSSALQCTPVYPSVLQCPPVHTSVLQVYSSVHQCTPVYSSVSSRLAGSRKCASVSSGCSHAATLWWKSAHPVVPQSGTRKKQWRPRNDHCPPGLIV